jgi:hypothetical protein
VVGSIQAKTLASYRRQCPDLCHTLNSREQFSFRHVWEIKMDAAHVVVSSILFIVVVNGKIVIVL